MIAGSSLARRTWRETPPTCGSATPSTLSYAAANFLALPYLGIGILAVNAVMIFGDKRQCLHDRIAGTQVISLD